MTLFFNLLTTQALLGAFDNLWHHEITERLPAKRSAATEISLHAARELLYAVLFLAFAWFEWRGAWAALILVVMAAEVIITLIDFIVEDRTRRLPPLERVLHTLLAINFGIALAVLAPILLRWLQAPSAIVPVSYGGYSWMFSAFGGAALAWSIRNTFAALHHSRPPEWVRSAIVPGKSANPRNVLIGGATGFVGSHLVRRLIARGDTVTVITRDADRALDRFGPHVRVVTDLNVIDAAARFDAIVNLAGATILGLPWTQHRRSVLVESRVSTTRALVNLCARLERPPAAFVNASAIGYYGIHDDALLDEESAPQSIFQSQLCQRWEEAALAAEAVCPRVVRLRLGLVLGKGGGALPALAMPVRLGMGAVLGSGAQWVSWIHIDDLVRLIEFAFDEPSMRGAVNAVAPHPETHLQFQRVLARTLHRPMWMRVPAFVVRAGLGEMAQLLLDGQRVLPKRALAMGFAFQHPDLPEALTQLER